MKRTTLAIAILFSLAGTAAVRAELPAEIKPLELEVIPAEAAAAVQQAVEALPATAAGAAVQAETDAPAAPPLAAEAAPAAAAAEQAPAAEMPATAATLEESAPVEPASAPEPAGESPATPEQAAAAADTPDTGAAAMPGRPPCPKYGMGMGPGPGGKGGMKPGCDCCGKGMRAKHEEVVQRLDMIEARMAKIEAMLESLMKRAQDE